MSSSSDSIRELLLPFLLIFITFRTTLSHETSLLREMKAECNKDGITVKLWFRQPFNGVAYSYGYHDKEKCTYIGNEDNEQIHLKRRMHGSTTNFSFLIPANDCGTEYRESHENPKADTVMSTTTANQHLKKKRNRNPVEANEIYIENTLLIQKDPAIQEAGDLAQRLRCVWRKEILKPLVASFPFGNSNTRSSDVPGANGRIKSEIFRDVTGVNGRIKSDIFHDVPGVNGRIKSEISQPFSYYRSSNYTKGASGVGSVRFQPKGQVQNVPYSSYGYRRKPSRSLPITEADRRRDELILKAEKTSKIQEDKTTFGMPGHFDFLRSGADVRQPLLSGLMMPILVWMLQ